MLALRHLPTQLNELGSVIGRMLISDFQEIVGKELDREVERCRGSETATPSDSDERGSNASSSSDLLKFSRQFSQIDEEALGSVVVGLIRQNSFTFLELLEEAGVAAIKKAIKEVNFSSFERYSIL